MVLNTPSWAVLDEKALARLSTAQGSKKTLDSNLFVSYINSPLPCYGPKFNLHHLLYLFIYSIHYLQSNKLFSARANWNVTSLNNNKMKMTYCYLKTLKFAMYFFPMILSSHRYPCLPAAGRETIEANLLLQIN